jgi:hypothetical protein
MVREAAREAFGFHAPKQAVQVGQRRPPAFGRHVALGRPEFARIPGQVAFHFAFAVAATAFVAVNGGHGHASRL